MLGYALIFFIVGFLGSILLPGVNIIVLVFLTGLVISFTRAEMEKQQKKDNDKG